MNRQCPRCMVFTDGYHDCRATAAFAEVEAQLYEIKDRLNEQRDYYERMRPVWAQGYTEDSLAAQGFSSALAQLYALLGASNQTEAVSNIRSQIKPAPDANVAALQQLLGHRSETGLAKYGTTTERTDLTSEQWLQHLLEELLDAAVYTRTMLSQPKDIYRQALEYIYGDIDAITWKGVVHERLVPPLPQEEHLKSQGLTGPSIREAAVALVEKLEQVHNSGAYLSVWQTAQFRNGPYNGPTYIPELADLRQALGLINPEQQS